MLGVFPDGGVLNEARLLELRLQIPLEHHVLLQGEVQNQAVLVPVLGNVAHVLAPAADGGMGDVLAAQLHGAAGDLIQARQALDELRLAVAVDTGDAHDLSGPDLQAHVVNGVPLVLVGGHAHVPHPQNGVLGLGRLLHHLQLHRAAHHHVGQLLLVGVAGVHRAHIPALAQNGDPIRHGHDLVELVGDKQDGLALLGKAAHDVHQLVDLLGSQNGGGLVEDEDLVVAIQHLQDLHPLLHTHGDVLHLGVQVHPQAVPLGQLLDLLPGRLFLQEAQLGILRAQDDVVQDGEHVDELEVLVHHADAQRRCVIGVVDLHRLAVFADLALLRLIQAEQDGHQRGLACAVFAQQGVDLTLAQLQGDVVVGLDAGKLLGDVKHFDHILGRLLHAATYFLSFSCPLQSLPPADNVTSLL